MSRNLASTLRNLKREENRLKSLRRTLREEKVKQMFQNESTKQKTSSSSSFSTNNNENQNLLLDYLPKNRSLEVSMAMLFTHGKDPRIFLDVTQRLLGCTVLSLASPTNLNNNNTSTFSSPGRWDPFDIRPQVFALGKHMALPIFTSLPMLRQFCWKHDFSVRGPDGAIWSQAGCAPPDARKLTESVSSSTSTSTSSSFSKKEKEKEKIIKSAAKETHRKIRTKREEQQELTNSNNNNKKDKKLKQSKNKKQMRKKLLQQQEEQEEQERQQQRERQAQLKQQKQQEQEQKAILKHEQLLASAASIEQFEMRTVTPINISYGVVSDSNNHHNNNNGNTNLFNLGNNNIDNFFFGYYGMLTTVLENASILPGETDIIVNPTSPIELALSHNLSANHLSNRNAAEYLVHSAFIRVEKKLRKEFFGFFSRMCPEVVTARSATMRKNFGLQELIDDGDIFVDGGGGGKNRTRNKRNRRSSSSSDFSSTFSETQHLLQSYDTSNESTTPVPPELLRPDAFDIVILIDTRNYSKTAQSLQRAKSVGAIIGHASLRVIPIEDAPPHVCEVAEIFYTQEENFWYQQKKEQEKQRRKRYLVSQMKQQKQNLSLSSTSFGTEDHQKKNNMTSSSSSSDEYDDVDNNDDEDENGLELLGDSVIVNSHTPQDSLYSNPQMAYTESHAMQLKKKLV